MTCTIVAGGQWGDEGKGKIVSYLSLKDNPSIVCRGGLGPGAGHTVVYKGKTYITRHLPSGFVNEKVRLLVGAGVLINPEIVYKEICELGVESRVGIDFRCTIVEQKHIDADRRSHHLLRVIRTTGMGHGPAFADRALRVAKLVKDIDVLEPYLADVALEINSALDSNEEVIVEGANGFGLSVLYGTYPYVVGKDTNASTIVADVGIGPKRVNEVILVFKTFPTRSGSGPFPTEMSKKESEQRGLIEYGTVTGRRRRIGYFDKELAKCAVKLNAPTQIAVTSIDRIDPSCKGAVNFDSLSNKAVDFINLIEDELKAPVTLIGTGPDIWDIIDLREGM